jgi:hypothetical protein
LVRGREKEETFSSHQTPQRVSFKKGQEKSKTGSTKRFKKLSTYPQS